VRLWLLGSGSKGNALLLECGETRVLVDAGFSSRRLAERMRRIGVAPESIDALVLTHEHTDHISGVEACVKRWGWPVYGTPGTIAAMAGLRFTGSPLARQTRITIGRIELEAIPISHDATDPVGYVATATCSGLRAAIMTDLGVVTSEVRAAVRHADVLVIESNHDEIMLRDGPYPSNLKRRVAGRHGHLSNAEAGTLAGESVHRGLQSLVLAHLSEINNTPRAALDTLGTTIRKTRWRGRATVAKQDQIVGPFGDASRVAKQLTLF
jgi:phosphoribosyl 1,2-cyclic phosphodiesterase